MSFWSRYGVDKIDSNKKYILILGKGPKIKRIRAYTECRKNVLN